MPKVQGFLSTVLKSACDPLEKVKDFFYRVEVQQRGSHIHMLVWIVNTPTLEKNAEEKIVQFVDKYLTCNIDNEETSSFVNFEHINTQERVERRKNQYIGLDFHCLHFQEQCYYIPLKRKLKSTTRNTKSFKKLRMSIKIM